MKLNNTHKKILVILEKNPVDDIELGKLINMKPSGMRARISELRSIGYKIERKYTLVGVDKKQ